MAKDFVISADNVCKRYLMGVVEVRALCEVNLGVERGDYISIMGPSGSGKTTLLNVLSCLLRPTSGEIKINGRAISKMDDDRLARIRGKTIGFIFQTFNLLGRMTALENVMLPLWFEGIPLERRREIAVTMLGQVGLEDRMHHRPSELSGGQRQRVAIARALANDPDIIVADEPTGNLDSKSGDQILEIIDRLNKKDGKTVLMVTHEEYVAKRANRTIFLRDGKIVQEVSNGRGKRS